MKERRTAGQESRQLDGEYGRKASAGELSRHLPTAPEAFLEGALDNPSLSAREVPLLLRNRRASATLLNRIAGVARWVTERPVRKGLLGHPQVTPALAARLLPDLHWKDLAETCVALRVPAAVRHKAEQALLQRLDDLTLGERIALARSASRGVIPALLASQEVEVLRGLLGNPRLLETEALELAGRSAPRPLLSYLAEHPRFLENTALMIALASNPQTPVGVALDLVSRLDQGSRQRLSNDDKVPRIVRVAAERARSQAASGTPETPHLRVRLRGHRS